MKRDENQSVEYKESWHDKIEAIKRLEPPERAARTLRRVRRVALVCRNAW